MTHCSTVWAPLLRLLPHTRRQLRPARYQLVQEVTALEQAGKTVADMESLIAELMPPGARVSPHFKRMVDRATQLMQRHVLMRGGSPPVGRVGRYKGFVPPYHSHSRVFDANELRSAATQARTRPLNPMGCSAHVTIAPLSCFRYCCCCYYCCGVHTLTFSHCLCLLPLGLLPALSRSRLGTPSVRRATSCPWASLATTGSRSANLVATPPEAHLAAIVRA